MTPVYLPKEALPDGRPSAACMVSIATCVPPKRSACVDDPVRVGGDDNAPKSDVILPIAIYGETLPFRPETVRRVPSWNGCIPYGILRRESVFSAIQRDIPGAW